MQFSRFFWTANRQARHFAGSFRCNSTSHPNSTLNHGLEGCTVERQAAGRIRVTLDKSYDDFHFLDARLSGYSASNDVALVDKESWDGGNKGHTTGTNTDATKDTDPDNTLRIRLAGNGSFVAITVTVGAAVAVATIVAELNAAFLLNFPKGQGEQHLRATALGDNTVKIFSVSPGVGFVIDTTAAGSTLNTALGFAAGGVTASPSGANAFFDVITQSTAGTAADLAADVADVFVQAIVKGGK